MAAASNYVVHTTDKHRIERAVPLTDGTDFQAQGGYVTRRKLLIFWALYSEIEDTIDAYGRTDNFILDGEPIYSFSAHRSLLLYDVEVNFVKYEAS